MATRTGINTNLINRLGADHQEKVRKEGSVWRCIAPISLTPLNKNEPHSTPGMH